MKITSIALFFISVTSPLFSQQWNDTSGGIYYNSGKVGIGAVNPSGLLHVGGMGSHSWIYFSANVNGTGNPQNHSGLAFGWNRSGGAGESSIVYNTNLGSAPGLEFSSFNGSVFTTEMALRAGKLGVGTNAPQNMLDVVGPFSVSEVSTFVGQDHNFGANTGRYGIGLSFEHIDGGTNAGKKFHINTWIGNSRIRSMSFDHQGNVGVGTSNPMAKFDVGHFIPNGTLGTVLGRLQEGNSSGAGTYLGVKGYSTQFSYEGKSFALEHSFFGVTNSSINFFRGGSTSGGFIAFNTSDNSERMRITTEGNVGIGTTTPDQKLTVDGTVRCEEVRVELIAGSGPDYVFEPTYNLLPLSEVETYIKANKHLPEVPSAKQMEAEGLNLKEMNLLLLKKVEELTLHLIEQSKTIDQHKKVSTAIVQENNELRVRIEVLEKSLKK
jgi:hypothetical protein